MLVLQMDARGTSIQPYIPIELYTPFAPRPFEGSDGKTHLAFEMHITNFYRDTGAIVLEELQIAHGTAGTRLVELDAAIVRASRDGVSDRPPLAQLPPPSELTLDAVAGNYVVLELGANTFALYAHFQRDSVTVRAGERVTRGDVLGRLGNSGNTSGPHLHFHISDAPGLDGEGLPFVIDSFDVLGETTANNVVPEWSGAEPFELAPEADRRSGLPLDGVVFRIP